MRKFPTTATLLSTEASTNQGVPDHHFASFKLLIALCCCMLYAVCFCTFGLLLPETKRTHMHLSDFEETHGISRQFLIEIVFLDKLKKMCSWRSRS
jgi:hypothetical protein